VKKKILYILIILLSFCAQADGDSKIIGVLYDDSGSTASLSGKAYSTWFEMNIAVQYITSLLNINDKIFINFMNESTPLSCVKSAENDCTSDILAELQKVQRPTKHDSTPDWSLQVIDGLAKLENDQYSDKWFLFLTDGDVDGLYENDKLVQSKLDGIAKTAEKAQQNKINSIIINIGSNISSDLSNVWNEKANASIVLIDNQADKTAIIDGISEAGFLINRYSSGNNDVEKKNDHYIFKAKLPLFKLSLITPVSQLKNKANENNYNCEVNRKDISAYLGNKKLDVEAFSLCKNGYKFKNSDWASLDGTVVHIYKDKKKSIIPVGEIKIKTKRELKSEYFYPLVALSLRVNMQNKDGISLIENMLKDDKEQIHLCVNEKAKLTFKFFNSQGKRYSEIDYTKLRLRVNGGKRVHLTDENFALPSFVKAGEYLIALNLEYPGYFQYVSKSYKVKVQNCRDISVGLSHEIDETGKWKGFASLMVFQKTNNMDNNGLGNWGIKSEKNNAYTISLMQAELPMLWRIKEKSCNSNLKNRFIFVNQNNRSEKVLIENNLEKACVD